MTAHPIIPKRLKREPLIEAIWQIQFEPAPSQSVGDILPGVLYAELKAHHPGLRLHRLPIADFPAPVVQLDPNLRFAAKYRMEEQDKPFLFQVGDRVLTLNCRKPYSGWSAFKEKIHLLIEIVEKSGLIPRPRRHSLRYLDLLALHPAPDLSALQISLKVGQQKIHGLPLQLRLELPDGNCTHVVQIVTPAETRFPDGSQTGSILDMETFATATPDGWNVVKNQIDHLHDRSKSLFFEKLLTQEAINALNPEY
ncbi:MAG: TIGR04255 family protein [Burkholderiaceae bacterium]|jgi:uncharacterized protein (TIGR04255 family)|nr:TIGR04255 family protein [Burkholderiaceae bacterium]